MYNRAPILLLNTQSIYKEGAKCPTNPAQRSSPISFPICFQTSEYAKHDAKCPTQNRSPKIVSSGLNLFVYCFHLLLLTIGSSAGQTPSREDSTWPRNWQSTADNVTIASWQSHPIRPSKSVSILSWILCSGSYWFARQWPKVLPRSKPTSQLWNPWADLESRDVILIRIM